MPELSALKLEDGRRGLVRFVEANRPQGSFRNSITIVFDGRSDIWGSASSGEVRVLFSQGQGCAAATADDLIKQIVEASATPGDIILVTDDRDLGYFCRAHGAQLWSVAQFLAQARKKGAVLKSGVRFKGAAAKGAARAEGKMISDRTANKINAELSRLWCK
jgi:hypothetical protein